MITGIYSPLGKAIASDVRNIQRPGIVLPVKKRDETLVMLDLDDQMVAMIMTGPHSFHHFSVSLRSAHNGFFVPEPEILIDFSSVSDGTGRQEEMGLLFLEQNKLSVVSSKAGDNFGDPHLVPLWSDVDGGSEGAKVAFSRWAIGIKDGDNYQVLWEYEHADASG
ncbi:hypothetical protein [Parasphingorhabdus sp.]|uniref:hypothetical protein n=1 Tax=Parasphingorhabdus sp. TaxID=2709688 RepID=UPI003A95DDB4